MWRHFYIRSLTTYSIYVGFQCYTPRLSHKQLSIELTPQCGTKARFGDVTTLPSFQGSSLEPDKVSISLTHQRNNTWHIQNRFRKGLDQQKMKARTLEKSLHNVAPLIHNDASSTCSSSDSADIQRHQFVVTCWSHDDTSETWKPNIHIYTVMECN